MAIKVGGWYVQGPNEVAVPDKIKKGLEQALHGSIGAKCEPLLWAATQVVAGTNHAVVAKMTAISPDAEPQLAMVYLFEALPVDGGEFKLVSFKDIALNAN
jgi:hypothetical protein